MNTKLIYSFITFCFMSMQYGVVCKDRIPLHEARELITPGCYYLANNIVGSIAIKADNVELDLNGYTLDGNGLSVVISASNQNNISIINGSIYNQGNTGISLVDCKGVTIKDMQWFDCKRALELVSCSDSVVSSIKGFAYNTVKEGGGYVYIKNCERLRWSQVNIDDVEAEPLDLEQLNQDSYYFYFDIVILAGDMIEYGINETLITCTFSLPNSPFRTIKQIDTIRLKSGTRDKGVFLITWHPKG